VQHGVASAVGGAGSAVRLACSVGNQNKQTNKQKNWTKLNCVGAASPDDRDRFRIITDVGVGIRKKSNQYHSK
jgi:hypothetical protein